MSGLAADCNTLASKYNVDVNEKRVIDQVFHFTDDDAFHDMVEAAGITPLDFLEQKVGEALDPIRSLAMDDYGKDYSHIVAAKDNLFMLLID